MKIRKVILAKYLTLFLSTFLIASCGDETQNIADVVASHLERSKAYQDQGQYRASIIEARNIIKKDRNNNLGYLRLAELYALMGNHKGTSGLIENIPSPDAESQILLAAAYIEQRKFTSASKALDEYSFQGGDTSTEQYQLLEIQVFASNNKLEETGAKLTGIAEKFPNSIEAQNLLARFLVGQKRIDEATTLTEQTLTKAPKDPETLLFAAQLSYVKNDLPAAEAYLTRALLELKETDLMLPTRSNVLRRLSTVLTEQGRTTEALAYSKLLTESNPEAAAAQSQLRKASQALKDGNIEEAEEILLALSKKHPNNTMVALYLGLIDYQQGDFSSASELLSSNIDTEISSPQIIQTTAISLLRQNKISEAQNLLNEAMATHKDEPKLLALYGLTSLQNELTEDDGILAIQRSLAMNPKMYSLRLALARHYLSKRNTEQAQAQLKLVLKEDPGNIPATSLYAQILESIGDQSAAESAINAMLKQKPNDSSAINLAARYALSNDNSKLAQERFIQSIETKPENPEALANLASLSMQQQDYKQALTYYNKLVVTVPNIPAGYKGIVNAMEASGQADAAIAKLIAMADIDNKIHPTAAAVAAEYYLRKNNVQAAIPLIEKAITAEQSPYIKSIAFQAAVAKAGEAVNKEDWATARKTLVDSASYSNSTLQIESLLADIETRSGNFKEAQRLIEKLMVDYPSETKPILANAKLLDSQNKEQQATEFLLNQWSAGSELNLGNIIYGRIIDDNVKVSKFLTQWKAKNPDSPQPYIFSALSAQKQNNSAVAIADYEKALSLKPGNATVLNNLAWLYHETADERAESTAEQAYQLAPKSPAIMDTYGWILVQNGKIKKGKALLMEALELAPPGIKSEIEDHLSKVE